jgi:hypothetical protein
MDSRLRERFLTLISELQTNSNIRIVCTETPNGLDNSIISKLLADRGVEEKADLRTFYEQLNGLTIWWIHVRNPKYNKAKFDSYGDEFDMEAMQICDGFISIERLKNVLKPSMAIGTIIDEAFDDQKEEFLGNLVESQSLRKNVMHFDYFDYSGAENTILVYFGAQEETIVFLPTEDYADFSDTRYISLSTYVEFLLWSKGLKKARYDFFKQPENYQNEVESLDQVYFDAQPQIDIDNLY